MSYIQNNLQAGELNEQSRYSLVYICISGNTTIIKRAFFSSH